MERLEIRYNDSIKANESLGSILKEPFSIIVRDATIQRFEYTFEAFWKFVKEYLKEIEGVIGNSPKRCFRELFSLGILNETEVTSCCEMTDRRNETSHTYKEKVAEIIFLRVKNYHILMTEILNRLQTGK